MEIYKSYKIRIFPTKEQERKFLLHIGACRFIWNYMLEKQENRHQNGDSFLSAFEMINLLKPLKNDGEHGWLYEVSNKSLQRTCSDLSDAYVQFFKKNRNHPKFKSKKKSKFVYPINTEVFYFQNEKFLNIEKVGKVKYKMDFSFPFGKGVQKYSNVRVSYKNNKWFVSFGIKCESQTHNLQKANMGIDLGIKDLATVEFDGEQIIFNNINKSKQIRGLKKKLVHTQRRISRKYEQNKQGNKFVKTNNIIREENKLRKIYARITNIRYNYIHQTTHKLISMFPKCIVMEDLNVIGMMKNRHLSKAIQEQYFSEFIRQMKYKCEWNGIEFVQADRFYPSSKTCSGCGCIKSDLKLSDRTYICNECGLVIDRDYNAAVNLSRYVS